MREESNKPRNSREMAVRNQFFTPEYIVRFLTDNSLGRIWYEMTGGQSRIGEEQCQYMVRCPDETIEIRAIKEPTEILSMDPTCGSMHFGLYLYEVYEYIYMDVWDNHPELLVKYREVHTRDSFHREVPKLILENNIYGCEIDPRALQLAALSLWLRAQRSYGEMGIEAVDRPLIKKSNLVLAEAMPGNKKLLKGLMEELDKPMQNLIKKIWDKMQFVGEAGLLFKMEKEIDDEIDYLRKNWTKVNQYRYADLFATDEEKAKIEMENEARRVLKENKEEFFKEITERLKEALQQLSAKLSEEEGYENALFSDDATRGFAFIELCQKRFDCIVMNPPFGEGSEHTSGYLDDNYPAWCRNLVCAFFIRMKDMLIEGGKLGAIFDRTIYIRKLYAKFRTTELCGCIDCCLDTGWGVLDAIVETSTLVLEKFSSQRDAIFIDLRDEPEKGIALNNYINVNFKDKSNIYVRKSSDFGTLPNAVIGYYFDDDVISLFQNNANIAKAGYESRGGYKFFVDMYWRLYFEVDNSPNHYNVANGGNFSLFYSTYRDKVEWIDDGIRAKAIKNFQWTSPEYQKMFGLSYGEQGDILDAQIMKSGFYFTQGFYGIPLDNVDKSFSALSYINSILPQYVVNLYTGVHKKQGYVNQLPIISHTDKQIKINELVLECIEIKRHFFSLDETNLEYHGLIAQLNISSTIETALDNLQSAITADYNRYQELVEQNDDLWMDLAKIDRDSDFRKTLNEYKSRRPYEELLSIDGASSQNIIDKKVMAQEIMMELVGMAFGRWDTAYAKGQKAVPEFGDVFDALPFMPVVSLDEVPAGYAVNIPEDGILSNQTEGAICLSSRVRDVMHYLWAERADDLEYELCKLIGCKNLQAYFESPTGFFEYHFKRYTKSRRKAPIYWPLSSEDGSLTYWVYYPKLSKNTLPSLILKLRDENEAIRSNINNALVAHDKVLETNLRAQQQQVEGMIEEITRIIDLGYEPNHDDGVPVTSCPLVNLIRHRGWSLECASNLEDLQKGDYDWSHLAMSMFPSRVTQKAKKDWCMALTHGLEHLCENKPKEKKPRKKKADPQLALEF